MTASSKRGAQSEWRALAPALALSIVSFCGIAYAGYAPPEKGEMAVVFSPGIGEAQAYNAIVAAGGRVVSPSRFGNVVVVFAPDEGFVGRVRAQGGWLALAATGLCAPLNADA